MLWLPAISFGGGSWRLPLAPASAAAIVETLLLLRADDRSARLAQAIERDPSLALWAFCRESLDGARELNSAAALAGWLAASAIDVLDGVQAEEPPDESHRSVLFHAADAWQASASGRRSVNASAK